MARGEWFKGLEKGAPGAGNGDLIPLLLGLGSLFHNSLILFDIYKLAFMRCIFFIALVISLCC